ncbi:MAG: YcaO-like family protein [Cocleimonas sp.]
MTLKTHTHENEIALDDTITRLQEKLLEAGFNIVEQSWLNPVVNIWSVRTYDQDCPLLFSSGKGISKKSALTSALEEFVQRLSTNHFWADCYLGDEVSNSKFVHSSKEKWFKTNSDGSWPEGILSSQLCEFYNSDDELNSNNLIDNNSANSDRGICCIPYECLGTGEKIYFPTNITDNIYASNGMATANSIEEARIRALSEVLNNYIKFKIIAEGISLPDVPDKVLNHYPDMQSSIKEINAAGYQLLIQDASLGGKYPVLAVTLINPKDQGLRTSFGAHPKFEIALQESLTGLLQGIDLNQLGGFVEAGFDMDEIASPHNLEKHFKHSNGILAWSFLKDRSEYEFTDWDKQDSSDDYVITNTTEELNKLVDLIHSEGNGIFISEHNEIGIYTCRIIVPGMSEIYPIDDLVWENNNAGMGVRDRILKGDMTHHECEQLIQELEDLNLGDEYLIAKLIGMPADTNNIFEDLRVAELITLLALKTQDNERIQEGCEWLLHYQQINTRRLKTYQCINTILQLDGMTNFGNALEKLYTRSILNDALALISGEDVFLLISDWEMHGLLIEAYKKIN